MASRSNVVSAKYRVEKTTPTTLTVPTTMEVSIEGDNNKCIITGKIDAATSTNTHLTSTSLIKRKILIFKLLQTNQMRSA